MTKTSKNIWIVWSRTLKWPLSALIIIVLMILGGLIYGNQPRRQSQYRDLSAEADVRGEHNTPEEFEAYTIDDFYIYLSAQGVRDLRSFPEKPSDAELATAKVVVVNLNQSDDQTTLKRIQGFLQKVDQKQSDYLRFAQYTVEGDLIFVDILYNADRDKVYIVDDSTRDRFSAPPDRSIQMYEYDQTGFHSDVINNNSWWVAWNGNWPEIAEDVLEKDRNEIFWIMPISTCIDCAETSST